MASTFQTKLLGVFLMIAVSGTDPAPSLGCPYDIVGDLNNDCRVDLLDIALVTQNWLVDCNLAPDNAACLPRPEWRLEAPMSLARDQFTGGVIDGKIYVFGGNGDPDGFNLKSTAMYDPVTKQWSLRSDNWHNYVHGDYQGVEELTGVVLDGKLYVFGANGGIGPSGQWGDINFVEQYDPAADRWKSLADKPTLVTAAPAVVYDNEIYLFGGSYNHDGLDEGVVYDVVEAYNPATNKWRSVTHMPQTLMAFALAVVGDKAYVIAGYVHAERRITGAVMEYDFKADTWDTESCAPMPAGRARGVPYGSAAPVIDGRVFVVGGVEVSGESVWASDKIDIYDPAKNEWQEGPSLPASVDDHLTLVLANKIYILGGRMRRLRTCFSAQF